jgi:large conductance mechanosensitive channel
VKSLVSDIILPPIALLPFINRNLHEKFFVLRKGPAYPYNTLKQAAEDGAVTLAWG